MDNAQVSTTIQKIDPCLTQQGAFRRCVWGYHLIVELWNVPFEKLDRAEVVSHILEKCFDFLVNGHRPKCISYQFQPFGVSAQIHLGFNNLYIHTWPEKGYAAIDIIADSKEKAYKILENLQKYFTPGYVCVGEVERGVPEPEEGGET